MSIENPGRELGSADYARQPKSTHELDSADADRRIQEQTEAQAAKRIVDGEIESPEQLQHRLDNLKRLSGRYGNSSDSKAP